MNSVPWPELIDRRCNPPMPLRRNPPRKSTGKTVSVEISVISGDISYSNRLYFFPIPLLSFGVFSLIQFPFPIVLPAEKGNDDDDDDDGDGTYCMILYIFETHVHSE